MCITLLSFQRLGYLPVHHLFYLPIKLLSPQLVHHPTLFPTTWLSTCSQSFLPAHKTTLTSTCASPYSLSNDLVIYLLTIFFYMPMQLLINLPTYAFPYLLFLNTPKLVFTYSNNYLSVNRPVQVVLVFLLTLVPAHLHPPIGLRNYTCCFFHLPVLSSLWKTNKEIDRYVLFFFKAKFHMYHCQVRVCRYLRIKSDRGQMISRTGNFADMKMVT